MKSAKPRICRREPITAPAAISRIDARAIQPRARGAVALAAKAFAGCSCIARLRQQGSLKCLFPRVYGKSMEAVLINTAGGVTGGDIFSLTARAGADAALTLTTQAAERAYRAGPDETGLIETQLAAEANARINWIPQETILFEGAALRRRLVVDLAEDARVLYCEPLVFGRLAMGETLRAGAFSDRVLIRRAGKPIYRDGLELSGDITAHLARPNIANRAGAMASLVFAAPEAAARLEAVRAFLPETGGASLLMPDVLVLRLLAADNHMLRQSLVPILTLLLQDTLPRCWMI